MAPWFGPSWRNNFAILQPKLEMGLSRKMRIRALGVPGHAFWGPATFWRTARRGVCSLPFPELCPSLGKQWKSLSSFIRPIPTPPSFLFLSLPYHTEFITIICLIFLTHKPWVKISVPKKFYFWPCVALSLVMCQTWFLQNICWNNLQPKIMLPSSEEDLICLCKRCWETSNPSSH